MADDVKIVMFCCNWCSYGGADTAGTARMQYPPNIRVIRVMCSGRIDPQFVLKAFKEGADGVFVAGCHMGDCHYELTRLWILTGVYFLLSWFVYLFEIRRSVGRTILK